MQISNWALERHALETHAVGKPGAAHMVTPPMSGPKKIPPNLVGRVCDEKKTELDPLVGSCSHATMWRHPINIGAEKAYMSRTHEIHALEDKPGVAHNDMATPFMSGPRPPNLVGPPNLAVLLGALSRAGLIPCTRGSIISCTWDACPVHQHL